MRLGSPQRSTLTYRRGYVFIDYGVAASTLK
nr:MAG TPA: hypothetical protein [Caudoviricetes sp.]